MEQAIPGMEELVQSLMKFLPNEVRRVSRAPAGQGSHMHVGDLANEAEASRVADCFLDAAKEYVQTLTHPVRIVIGPCFAPREGWGVLVRVERLADSDPA